jgi:hypothetical protein
MFDTLLIANRGAIATRILRTLKHLGIKSVVVYHEADVQSLHVQLADVAICLGGGSAAGGAGRGLEGSVRSLFTAPSSDFGSQIRSSPSFTPRPAVLSFPQSGPF